jgi:CMP-N-acetylneuraminic acid synthetase
MEAYQLYKQYQALSLISVTEFPCPPELALDLENQRVRRNWEGPARASNYKKRYYPNGAIVLVNRAFFARNKTFYSDDTLGYVMGWPDCIDIDHPSDYETAKRIIENDYGRASS